MGIESIIDRTKNREGGMWVPFQHHFIGAMAEEHRAVVFGLYANGYNHDCVYLIEISGEKLVQIVAQYEANMAQLDSEEQAAVLDIATQRYLESLEAQIHDGRMATKQSEIDATRQEFDAKFEALEQDRLAIETLQEKLSQAIAKANADIQVLEAKIAEAEIDRQYVEVEILQKQLDAARAELRVLEAGLKGLSLQLDIANAAVTESELRLEKQQAQQALDLIPGELAELTAQGVSLDADTLRTQTGTSLLDSEIAELQVKISKARLDAVNRQVDAALLDVDIAKARVDTAMVDVEVSQTESQTAREEARQVEYETDIAMVDVQVAQMQLDADKVQAQLKEIEADIARFEAQSMKKAMVLLDKQIAETKLANIGYEIPRKKQAQIAAIEKQIEILRTKIEASEAYRDIENQEYASRQTKQQAEHDYKMAMANLDILYGLHKAAIKIESFSKDVVIATEQQGYQAMEDSKKNRIPASQIDAAETKQDADLYAAELMATANIMNTMRHIIGSE